LSLRLLIDEDSQAKRLVKLLRSANHDVLTAAEAGLNGQPDNVVLDYAIHKNRTLLTFNCRDFQKLHSINSNHSGILAVYRDAQFSKNMDFQTIVKAIANIEASGISLTNQFISLNQWIY
jgi:predicted nuclease of predicted toxin-antitoxin system